jgi:hypothetical protein
MTIYSNSTITIPSPSLAVAGIGSLLSADATLSSNFGTVLRQFELTSSFAVTSAVVVSTTATLSNTMQFVLGTVFSGDIVEPQNFVSSFAVNAANIRVRDAEASFIRSPLRAVFQLTASPIQILADYTVALNSTATINARPFTNFVDADATVTANAGVFATAELAQPLSATTVTTAGLSAVIQFIDGTTRKFTTNQLTQIQQNTAVIVDFVEIYPVFSNPSLQYWDGEENVDDPRDYQPPLSVAYRWNSSGRDLTMLNYLGESRFYKGKNVMMNLPTIEYNNIFNKKTTKITINGLLGFFQSTAHVKYFDGATVVFGKAVYSTTNSVFAPMVTHSGQLLNLESVQIDTGVLLQQGLVNNIIFAGDGFTQSIEFEVSHGLYDYDQSRMLQTNKNSYRSYLDRTGLADDASGSRMGYNILEQIQWGLTRA